jgi:hypothetical protein
MNTIKAIFSKKSLVKALVVLTLSLVMATPVFANTINWAWQSNAGG